MSHSDIDLLAKRTLRAILADSWRIKHPPRWLCCWVMCETYKLR
jgi:hypothetical protein